jgi:16S rRNA (cytidine1402-2'-O)-methyltransferase
MHKLKVVGTPIGNLEDITIRALKELVNASVVVCEDTRNYIKLRSLLKERFENIIESEGSTDTQKVISYREQNHERITSQILETLEHSDICFVTDAGMPLISDPGYLLLKEVREKGVELEVIPGPTAIEPALIYSGFPIDKFVFVGFLPREKSKILKKIENSLDNGVTTVIYESPFRVSKSLEAIQTKYPDVLVSLSNDLTKKFEKVITGTISEVISQIKGKALKGEWVIVISNPS